MSRRELGRGKQALASFSLALPIAIAASIGLARIPGVPRDVSISIGFYLCTPIWVTCACALFVTERPYRTAGAWTLIAALLVAASRLA